MGIRTKNLQHENYQLEYTGTMSASFVHRDAKMILFDGKISNVVAKVQDGGTGATNNILDVNYNNTTIFAAATKITAAATTGVITYSTLSSRPFSVTAGSILSLDADQVATNATNAVVVVTVTRTGMVDEQNTSAFDDVL
jgi:hypothetical protein